jgi:serine protease Do
MKKSFWQPACVVLLTILALTGSEHRGGIAQALSFSNSQSESELLAKTAHVFNDLAKKSTPSVVSITTVKLLPAEASGMPEGEANPFIAPPGRGGARSPLGPQEGPNGMAHSFGSGNQHVVGLGSGIIIRSDGTILTNSHVVDHAERIQVSLTDNDEKNKYSAHLVGIDPKTDLAVIKLDKPAGSLPTLDFGDSDALKVGDWAIAVGSPYGLRHTVTFGIISATGRAQMGILDTEDFIQTDAAINPGSSGGPLLDAAGHVIGVNTAIFSQGGGFSGIGFAVPSKIAKEVSEQLIDHGRVIRGWIGLTAQDLDKDLAKHFHVSSQQGALISEVASGGPASEAEFRPGDVVVAYNNQQVGSATQFKSLVGKTRVGIAIPVDVSRKGGMKTLIVHIQEQPSPKEIPSPKQLAGQVGGAHDRLLGLSVEEIPVELSSFLKLPPKTGAIIVAVQPGSPGFDAGLSPGDIVLNVNDQDIHGVRDFNQTASHLKPTDAAVFYVQHGPTDKTFMTVKEEG